MPYIAVAFSEFAFYAILTSSVPLVWFSRWWVAEELLS